MTTTPTHYSRYQLVRALADASAELSARKEEVNRLNVFPVPDGDTGTNMSLTVESVIKAVKSLPKDASTSDIRRAVTQGALMGARGNSGVITSQILRGICEGNALNEEFNTACLEACFSRAVDVAFQAVRKPVEGTILTVLKDSAKAAKTALRKKMSTEDALEFITQEAYASVKRTPDLLPVLKENGVVDAGGFGLAILIDAFGRALTGRNKSVPEETTGAAYEPKVEIEHLNDWEGSRFTYCNEFLVESDKLDKDEALDFLATMGDCELCVGAIPRFKVHVHSNHPDQVLKYFLDRGQVFEVFIHNMRLQSEERTEKLAAEHAEEATAAETAAAPFAAHEAPAGVHKALGFVAVAAGAGNADILKSLGVDCIVSGGQTMNPSTKDLFDAACAVDADAIIILPDNKNIIMAANAAASLMDKPCKVVPTKSVPQAFSAMFAVDPDASIDENVEAMTDALQYVKTGEVTTAIKDSKDAHGNPIAEGDVIGIADGAIEAVTSTIESAVLGLLEVMDAPSFDTLTILAGEDMADDDFDALVATIEEQYPGLDIDPHRGEQPLYPIVMSLE